VAKNKKAIEKRAQTMVPGDNEFSETFNAIANMLHISAATTE
jgi:hypothetical protein